MAGHETLTARERVIRALNHEEPDRVPIDLGGFQTGIHRVAYQALMDHLGWDDRSRSWTPCRGWPPSEGLLEKFHVDFRYVTAHGPDSFTGGIEQNHRDGRLWYDLRDEFGVVWSMPTDQMLYMDISHHPLAEATMADLDRYPFPNGDDPSRFAGVRERALALRDETPYALSSGICGVVYEICWYLRGLERWFMDMLEQPEFCEALIDRTRSSGSTGWPLPGRGGRSARHHHDRRRSGRPARAAVLAEVLSVRGQAATEERHDVSSRTRQPRSGTTPAVIARRTSPT